MRLIDRCRPARSRSSDSQSRTRVIRFTYFSSVSFCFLRRLLRNRKTARSDFSDSPGKSDSVNRWANYACSSSDTKRLQKRGSALDLKQRKRDRVARHFFQRIFPKTRGTRTINRSIIARGLLRFANRCRRASRRENRTKRASERAHRVGQNWSRLSGTGPAERNASMFEFSECSVADASATTGSARTADCFFAMEIESRVCFLSEGI